MNALVKAGVEYALRKYKEPTSWAGLIAIVCTALHLTLDPALVQAIEVAAGALIGILFVIFNEPPKPTASAPVTDGTVADRLRTIEARKADSTAPAADVQPGRRADLRPSERGNDVVVPHAIRPGFSQ